MRRLVIAAFAAGGLMAAALPAHAQDATKVAQDFIGRWVADYNSGDAKGLAALFSSDGTWSPAAAALLRGRDEIAKAVAERIKAGYNKTTVTLTEAHQAGNVVWALGEYAVFGSGADVGKQIAGRFGAVYVRDGDAWHLGMLTGNGVVKK
jgi:uncharacterized protein (TIGR02246 family)